MTDENEYFYNPEVEGDYDREFVLDDDSGITWGNACDALRLLYEQHGHSGPFSVDEFFDAILDVIITPELKSLVDKGLSEPVMQRDGEMGWKLTEVGLECEKSIPDLVVENKDGVL
jgi:hypothetical protein